MKKYWAGQLKEQEYTSITTQLRKNQEKIKKDFIKKYKKVLPESARGELKNSISRQTRILDDYVDMAFNLFMTMPTKTMRPIVTGKLFYIFL